MLCKFVQRALAYSTKPATFQFRNFIFHNNMMASFQGKGSSMMQKQNFDFFLVLDFEATCDNNNPPKPQEIIEFPVLKVNASTCKVDSIFHQYVLPQSHPQLRPFCTEKFHTWMVSEKLFEPDVKSIFVTCGDWDLRTMLPRQCSHLALTPQNYFKRWINIKKSFADMTGVFPKGMMPMLIDLHLKHTGRHHSGIDDSHNIANILCAMIQRGYVF